MFPQLPLFWRLHNNRRRWWRMLAFAGLCFQLSEASRFPSPTQTRHRWYFQTGFRQIYHADEPGYLTGRDPLGVPQWLGYVFLTPQWSKEVRERERTSMAGGCVKADFLFPYGGMLQTCSAACAVVLSQMNAFAQTFFVHAYVRKSICTVNKCVCVPAACTYLGKKISLFLKNMKYLSIVTA